MTSTVSLLAGSTGFLGNEILKELGKEEGSIFALSRRRVPNLPSNAKELIIDFNNLSEELNLQNIEHLYLSLGQALYFHNVMGLMSKSLKREFYLVDFTYQFQIAKKAKEAGVKNISLVSAVGANPNSWNYYLKTKGLLEEEIVKLDFETTNIFRPGHLTGNKFRFDVFLADLFSFFADPFLFGPLKKFRSISIKKLPKAIMRHSQSSKPGINYFDFKDFK